MQLPDPCIEFLTPLVVRGRVCVMSEVTRVNHCTCFLINAHHFSIAQEMSELASL